MGKKTFSQPFPYTTLVRISGVFLSFLSDRGVFVPSDKNVLKKILRSLREKIGPAKNHT